MSSISRRSLIAAAALAPVALKAQTPAPAAMAERPDHFQLSIADLDQGIAIVRDLTGVEPAFGGAHPGNGTRNALLSLGDGSYLEILALDPAQPEVKTPRTEWIRSLTSPAIRTYAMRTTAIDRKQAAAQEIPGISGKLLPGSRKTPDGSTLEWANLTLESPFGQQMPFFIDWKNSPHPSLNTPAGCHLLGFEVLHPDAQSLRDIYRKLEIAVTVNAAPKAGFIAHIATPKGTVTFLG